MRSLALRVAVVIGLLLSAAVLAALFYDVNGFPATGFDEWYFLSRFERLVRYGDASDVVGFDQFAGNGDRSKLPPLLFPARFGLHLLLARGAEASRFIGAAEFAILALLIALLARRRGAPLELALLGPGAFLCFPTVFFFARTYRYEQDVFFTGTLSLLLPLLAGPPAGRRVACFASGLLAGAAATMHPMGLLFPAAHALDHVARHRAASLRGPALRQVLSWLGALTLPVLATVAYYASDWQGTRVYWEGTRVFHFSHHPYRIRSLLAWRPLPPWLPDQVAAAVNAVRWGLTPFPVAGWAGRLSEAMAALWSVAVVAMCVAAGMMFFRRLLGRKTAVEGRGLTISGLCSAAILSALVTTAVYPANTDYVIHFAGLAWAGVYLMASRWAAGSASSARRATLFLLLALVTAAGLTVIAKAAAQARVTRRPTAPEQIRAMSDVANRLGLAGPGGERVYADTASWAGAGRRLAPLHEYLILEVAPRRPAYDGVVFSTSWYDVFVGEIATFTGQPIDPGRRRIRMAELVEGLTFGACLQSESADGSVTDSRLWLLRRPTERPILARQDPSGLEIELGERVLDDDFDVPAGAFVVDRTLRLPPGRYAAMLKGPEIEQSRLSFRRGERDYAGPPLANFPHAAAGSVVFFESSGGESVAVAEGRAVAAGSASIRFWRRIAR